MLLFYGRHIVMIRVSPRYSTREPVVKKKITRVKSEDRLQQLVAARARRTPSDGEDQEDDEDRKEDGADQEEDEDREAGDESQNEGTSSATTLLSIAKRKRAATIAKSKCQSMPRNTFVKCGQLKKKLQQLWVPRGSVGSQMVHDLKGVDEDKEETMMKSEDEESNWIEKGSQGMKNTRLNMMSRNERINELIVSKLKSHDRKL